MGAYGSEGSDGEIGSPGLPVVNVTVGAYVASDSAVTLDAHGAVVKDGTHETADVDVAVGDSVAHDAVVMADTHGDRVTDVKDVRFGSRQLTCNRSAIDFRLEKCSETEIVLGGIPRLEIKVA